MRIQSAQIALLARSQERHFEAELQKHLREHHGSATARFDDAALLRAVREGIARARSHGITWQSKIAFFVALTFEIGPRFDEYPVIHALLRVPRLPPNERVDLLKNVPHHIWQVIVEEQRALRA